MPPPKSINDVPKNVIVIPVVCVHFSAVASEEREYIISGIERRDDGVNVFVGFSRSPHEGSFTTQRYEIISDDIFALMLRFGYYVLT